MIRVGERCPRARNHKPFMFKISSLQCFYNQRSLLLHEMLDRVHHFAIGYGTYMYIMYTNFFSLAHYKHLLSYNIFFFLKTSFDLKSKHFFPILGIILKFFLNIWILEKRAECVCSLSYWFCLEWQHKWIKKSFFIKPLLLVFLLSKRTF